MTWRIELPHYGPRGGPLTFKRGRNGKPVPALTDNTRVHWAKRSSLQKAIRTCVAQLARAYNIPAQEHITVRLEYHVLTRHRRDEDNLSPITKPAFDGLGPAKDPYWSPAKGRWVGAAAGANIVPDDTPTYMAKDQTRIVHAPERSTPVMVLVIEPS